MTYLTDGKVGVDLTATPTTIEHTLGEMHTGTDGTMWVYVQANGAIAQYDFVGIDENYQAACLTDAMAGDGWIIGAAQVAFADNDYGWVAIKGSNISGNVLVSCAADVALYGSATAGSLDDSSTTGTVKIEGVVAVAAVGTAAGGAVEIIFTSPRSTTF